MVGHAGGREDLLAADLPLAGKRDRRDAHARRVRGAVGGILDRGPDRLDVVTFDDAVNADADREEEERREAGVARHARALQRQRDATHGAADQTTARRPPAGRGGGGWGG